MNRRGFLKGVALAAMGTPFGAAAWDRPVPPLGEAEDWYKQTFLDGAYKWDEFIHVKPFVQPIGERTLSIMWQTRYAAYAWMMVSQDEGATWRRVWSQKDGIRDVNTTFHEAVVADWDPSKKLLYRVVARPIEMRSQWGNVKFFGEDLPNKALQGYYIDQKAWKALVKDRKENGYKGEEFSEEGVLKPIDPEDFSLVMFNDVHHGNPRYPKLIGHAPENTALAFFCGDICDHARSEEDFNCFLSAPMSYVSRKLKCGVRFSRGNHETMGLYAPFVRRHVATPGGRLYDAFSIGGTRILNLDTGEVGSDDGFDWTQNYYGMDEYFAEERAWIEREVASGEWKGAKKRIVFAHIPPDGKTRVKELYAPLAAAGVTLLMCGHVHDGKFHAPCEARPYPMVTGGGPYDKPHKNPEINQLATISTARITSSGVKVAQRDLNGHEIFQTNL